MLEELRRIDDPYPYLRGLVSEVGFEAVQVPYNQPRRKRGITKNNFYTLYDIAMLGITSHSRVPLRIATMVGFALSGLSLVVSLLYLFLKIFFWSEFSAGTAPILIGMFFFASVQLFFIGLLGEYVGAILTHVMKRPLVVERERLMEGGVMPAVEGVLHANVREAEPPLRGGRTRRWPSIYSGFWVIVAGAGFGLAAAVALLWDKLSG